MSFCIKKVEIEIKPEKVAIESGKLHLVLKGAIEVEIEPNKVAVDADEDNECRLKGG